VLERLPADGVTDAALRQAAAAMTGEVQQVPPGISAIKVGGKRAYRLSREGTPPDLPARLVTITTLEITGIRRGAGPAGDLVDADVRVTCSSGTYIRAIARDLGTAVGTGGHLTALRRTRVGPYLADAAAPLDELAELPGSGRDLPVIALAEAAAAAFPAWQLTEQEARLIGHGGRLAARGAGTGPVAAFGLDGSLVALLTEQDGEARSLAVFATETS
ncbi:MAG: tRNA pseudouridine(55) synthase TruB, partial [Streptosporangiaceae bacterium]